MLYAKSFVGLDYLANLTNSLALVGFCTRMVHQKQWRHILARQLTRSDTHSKHLAATATWRAGASGATRLGSDDLGLLVLAASQARLRHPLC
jgi:hypothetical protein